MNFKFFFVLTILFSVQVLCDIQVIPAQTPELIEAYNQNGDFGASITLNVMENYLKNGDSGVPDCYKRIKQRYEEFTKNFAGNLEKAVTDVGKPLKPNHEKARQKTQAALRRMATILKECPPEIGNIFQQDDKKKMADKVKMFRIRFEHNFLLYIAEINKLKKTGKIQIAEKADRKVKEIREKAHKDSKEIEQEFEKCMGVEPPKNNNYDPRIFVTSYLG